MNKPTSELTLREMIEQNRRETEISPAATTVDDSAELNPAVFSPVTRRGFLAGLSAGSLLLMCRVGVGNTAEIADPAKVNAGAFAPDLWVSIAPDGRVTILASRSEMGTGCRTGLPTVLADEMEADWSRVVIKQAQGDRRLGDQNTDGSNSIRFFFDTMRTTGAIARTMLERAAAQQWKVDPSECYAEMHQVKHKGNRQNARVWRVGRCGAKAGGSRKKKREIQAARQMAIYRQGHADYRLEQNRHGPRGVWNRRPTAESTVRGRRTSSGRRRQSKVCRRFGRQGGAGRRRGRQAARL
jgi:hypothetical protein